jgi:Secretion system C-terminal sorting domain
MKISTLLTTLLAFICLQAHAQTSCSSWARGGGSGQNHDGFPAGVAAFDGGKSYFAGAFGDTIGFAGQTLDANGKRGLFLNEYNGQGDLVWSKLIATGQNFFGFQTIVERGGDLFLLGGSAEIYVGNDSMIGNNLFLIKIDTAGNVVWDRIYGPGSASMFFADAAPDGNGGLYLCGRMRGTIVFGSTTVSAPRTQVLLAHIDGSGNALWAKASTDLGHPTPCRGNAIALSASGNLLVSGFYSDSLVFDSHAIGDPNYVNHTKSEMWLGAFDVSGNNLWLKGQTTSSVVSLSSFDVAYGLATDAANNIYLSGAISDTTDFFGMPFIAGAAEPTLAKFDANGSLLWAQRCTQTGSVEQGGLGVFTQVHVNSQQEPIVTGWVNDSLSLGGQLFPQARSADFCKVHFDGLGGLVDFHTYGGELYETSYASDLDADDNLYIAGAFSTKSLTPVPGSTLQNASLSPTDTLDDALLLKICNNEIVVTTPAENQPFSCKVFPNPTAGDFGMRWTALQQNAHLEISDVVGKIILQQTLEAGVTALDIDARYWQAGIYVWKIVADQAALAQGKIALVK